MKNLNIYDPTIEELKRRKVEDADVYGPYFVISYGCHAFNLLNESVFSESEGTRAILMINGQLPNMRNHLMFMAPPGSGKSFFLKSFSNKVTGIFRNGGISFHEATAMTGAGLVGTIKQEADGTTSTVAGDAAIYHHSIFVMEEFMAIMKGMGTSFNADLEAQILMTLDSGDVYKRLAHGPLAYHTSLSMWVGIQPIKVNLEGGLGRRFCYILNIPSREDQERYMEAAMDGENVHSDAQWLAQFHRRTELWNESLRLIKSVRFHSDFYTLVRKVLKCRGHEVDIYRRLALGYHLTRYGASEHVIVKVDPTIKKIMLQQADWRTRIKQSPRVQQIVQLLQTDGKLTEKGFGLTKAELITYGSDLELSAQLVHDLITDAVKLGYVKVKGNVVVLEPTALNETPVMQRARDAGLLVEEPRVAPEINYDLLTYEETYDEYDLFELRDYAEENFSHYQ